MSKVTTTFEAVDNGMVATIQKIERETKSMKDTTEKTEKQVDMSFAAMAKAGAGLAVGIGLVKGAFAALTGTLDNFSQALDLGGRLEDLSSRTGETAGNLLLLERAFDNSGIGADKVGSSINKLQKFMSDANSGTDKNVEALKDLGLTYSMLTELSPTEQLGLLAERINSIQSPTERAAMAMKIFGKSGGEILPLLQNFSGEIGNARGELGSMVDIMNQRSAVFDTVSDKIAVIKGKFMEFAAGILDKAAPALEIITTMLSKIDAAGLGQKLAGSFAGLKDTALTFGDILLGAITNAKQGIELFRIAFVYTAQEFGNLLLNAIPNAAKILGASLVAGFKTAFNNFNLLAVEASAFFQSKLLDAYVAVTSLFSDEAGRAARKQADTLKEGLKIIVGTYSNEIDEANFKIEQDFMAIREKIDNQKPVDYFGAEDTKSEMERVTADLLEKGKQFREKFTEIPLSFSMETEANVKAAAAFGEVKDFWKNLSKEQPDPLKKMKESSEKVSVKMEKIVEKVKELTLLEKLNAQMVEAKTTKEAKIKPLEEEFKKQVEGGKFRQAEMTMKQIEKKQEEAAIRIDAKGKVDRRDLEAIAREEGIKTGGKSKAEIRKEILEKRKEKQPEEQKKEAEKKEQKVKEAEKKVEDKADALFNMVESIKNLVALIEPKLPTHALAL
jgi:hypothetical protein